MTNVAPQGATQRVLPGSRVLGRGLEPQGACLRTASHRDLVERGVWRLSCLDTPPPQIAALCALAVYVLGLERRVEGLLGVLGVQSPAEKTLRMGHLAMAILYRALDWQIQEASTLHPPNSSGVMLN